jgi:uncharacterized protein YkwD
VKSQQTDFKNHQQIKSAKARGKQFGAAKRYKELLSIGAATPKEALWRWLIDDGNEARANRKLLLDSAWTHCGVGVQRNSGVHSVVLLALAVDYVEK